MTDLTAGPDEALSRLLSPLDGLEERPVAEHPAAYEQVHAGLRAVLTPGPSGGPSGGDTAARA